MPHRHTVLSPCHLFLFFSPGSLRRACSCNPARLCSGGWLMQGTRGCTVTCRKAPEKQQSQTMPLQKKISGNLALQIPSIVSRYSYHSRISISEQCGMRQPLLGYYFALRVASIGPSQRLLTDAWCLTTHSQLGRRTILYSSCLMSHYDTNDLVPFFEKLNPLVCNCILLLSQISRVPSVGLV